MSTSGSVRRAVSIASDAVYTLSTAYPAGRRMLSSERENHSCAFARSTSGGWEAASGMTRALWHGKKRASQSERAALPPFGQPAASAAHSLLEKRAGVVHR